MLWTFLGILLTASTVQAQAVSDWDHFKLFNACRPMMLVVEGLPPDAYDYQTRTAADKLHDQVAKKYGQAEKLDPIFPDSIWNEHRYWMMSMLKGDWMYVHYWNSDGGFNPVGHVNSPSIIARALSSDIGQIRLEFVLTPDTVCEEKIKQAESEAF